MLSSGLWLWLLLWSWLVGWSVGCSTARWLVFCLVLHCFALLCLTALLLDCLIDCLPACLRACLLAAWLLGWLSGGPPGKFTGCLHWFIHILQGSSNLLSHLLLGEGRWNQLSPPQKVAGHKNTAVRTCIEKRLEFWNTQQSFRHVRLHQTVIPNFARRNGSVDMRGELEASGMVAGTLNPQTRKPNP